MPSSVSFFEEDIHFAPDHPEKVRRWIQKVVQSEGFQLLELNFIFCSDPYLHQINQKYLTHDNFTDILTFDQSEDPTEIEGDIFISIDRVRDNAEVLNKTFETEIIRVMIHGVLHLMGFDDKTKAQKQVMRKKEDSCLSLYVN